jgi:hypothetical protein
MIVAVAITATSITTVVFQLLFLLVQQLHLLPAVLLMLLWLTF